MNTEGVSAERVTEYQVQVGAHVLRLNAVEATLLRDRLAILLRGIASDRIGQIQLAVASMFNVSIGDMMSCARPANLTAARQAAYWICRRERMTYERIGAGFHRDHGTVIHGVKACEDRMATDRKYRALVEQAAKLSGLDIPAKLV